MSEFYEDDEPVEAIVGAFDRADHGVTKKPRRTRVVVVRLTEAEHEAIKSRAKRERRTVSAVLRDGCYTPSAVLTITGATVGPVTMTTGTTMSVFRA